MILNEFQISADTFYSTINTKALLCFTDTVNNKLSQKLVINFYNYLKLIILLFKYGSQLR